MRLRAVAVIACFLVTGLSAQQAKNNLLADLRANDLASVERKLSLVSVDFAASPWCAWYLAENPQFRPETWDFLLSHKANPNKADEAGVPPLFYLVRDGDGTSLAYAISKGLDLGARVKSTPVNDKSFENATRTVGNTFPFQYNYSSGQVAWNALLSHKGTATIAVSSLQSVTALVFAAGAGNADAFAALLDAGADPLASLPFTLVDTSKTSRPKTAGQITVFELVFGGLAETDLANATYSQLRIASSLAAASQKLPKAKQPKLAAAETSTTLYYLAAHDLNGFRTKLGSELGDTIRLLKLAVATNALEIANLLLTFNQLAPEDDFGDDTSAVEFAASIGQDDMVRSWLPELPRKTGLKIRDAKSDEVVSLMSYYAEHNKKGMVEFLLAQGVNPNETIGRSSAIVSALKNTPILEVLLKGGADPNQVRAQTDDGPPANFPLTRAVETDAADAVRVLLNFKANPNVRSHAGYFQFEFTPLALAISRANPAIVRLLVDGGANLGVDEGMRISVAFGTEATTVVGSGSPAAFAKFLSTQDSTRAKQATWLAIANSLVAAGASMEGDFRIGEGGW